ncbi:Protein LIKE COV 3 [Glycine soja]|uniref:Protein LIKE COV 3 n=1 Tax=Glycine soja TaxID=3848 RepID=A0A445H2Z0_GLYSO|nr:Protein LIKE COV 3 [Glycine soja]
MASRDLELLIPVSSISENGPKSSAPSSPSVTSTQNHSSHEAFSKVIRSWASKKFMSGCVILLPIAITFYVTWGFIRFVDGTSVLTLGEWFIKKMPLVSYIYAASKQISAAISPDQSSKAFKEVAIIKHPRVGEYALGFITSSVVLRNRDEKELFCVYIPTNHLYLGDIYLISPEDILRPNLSVREAIEIVISGGMSIPQILTTVDADHAKFAPRKPTYESKV